MTPVRARVCVQMLAKWAEDDRQEKIKAEQRRQRMLEYRHLCNQLDTERHKQLIADKVSSAVSYTHLTLPTILRV